jgi:hypothetical protein
MNIRRLAQREAEHVLRHCHPVELERLDFETLDGNSTEAFCFYGQLTGDPDSHRAIELICQSTNKVICNDVVNDGKIVPVDELKVFLDSYDDVLAVKEGGTIIDFLQRSLYYVSPVEAYLPSEDHPERENRIAEIRQWLSM